MRNSICFEEETERERERERERELSKTVMMTARTEAVSVDLLQTDAAATTADAAAAAAGAVVKRFSASQRAQVSESDSWRPL